MQGIYRVRHAESDVIFVHPKLNVLTLFTRAEIIPDLFDHLKVSNTNRVGCFKKNITLYENKITRDYKLS